METEIVSPLEWPATPERLRQLAGMGILKPQGLEQSLQAIGTLPDRAKWAAFLDMVLLILGAGFLVSGIFFFFAFNWANLQPFVKLGLLEAAVLVAVGLAFWAGLDRLQGKIGLTAAGLLTGALLAVFGQIYQTGADAYGLFLLWAILISVWVFIGKFSPLWFVWLALFNLSLGFYNIQIVMPANHTSWFYIWMFEMFALNGTALLLWEFADCFGLDWLKSRWTPRLLALPVFFALTGPTVSLIFVGDSYFQQSADPWQLTMAALFGVCSLVVLYLYSQKIHDLFMLMICAASLMVVLNTWCFHQLHYDAPVLLFMGLFLIGQAAVVVTWLRRLSKSWQEVEA
jgi:uncharacterized membrane protein